MYVPQDKLHLRPIERLVALSESVDRSVSYLAVEAILEYLDQQESNGGLFVSDAGADEQAGQREGSSEPKDISSHRQPQLSVHVPRHGAPHELARGVSRLLLAVRAFGTNILSQIKRYVRLERKTPCPEEVSEQGDPVVSRPCRVIRHDAQRIAYDVKARGRSASMPQQYLAPYKEAIVNEQFDSPNALSLQAPHIVEAVVRVEGPVTTERILQILAGALGAIRLGRTLRCQLTEMIESAVDDARVRRIQYSISPDWSQDVLYLPDRSPLGARVLGPRQDLYHVPLPELGTHLRRTRKDLTAGGSVGLALVGLSEVDLLRLALKSYEVGRLTAKAKLYLSAAKDARYRDDMYLRELKREDREE